MGAILYSTEDIGDAYGPSLNAAFLELFEASGKVPQVLAPVGGRRTIPQEKALGGTAASDHVKGRAVDINNHRVFRNWDEPRFLQILAKHGWHNVQIDGQPFPHEPWHFANQSSTPQSSGSVPLSDGTTPTPRRKHKMTTLYNVGGTPTVALAGDSPGTPANWLETTARSLIDSWEEAHGPLNVIDAKTYAAWKAAYLTPLATSGSSGPAADMTHIADDLDAIEAAVKAIKIPTKASIQLS